MKSDFYLSSKFLETHPVDAAHILEELNPIDVADFLQNFPKNNVVASVLQSMDTASASVCLSMWSNDLIDNLFSHLPLNYAARLLRRIETEKRNSLLKGVSAEKRKTIDTMLRFSENTAGALMDPSPLVLPDDISIVDAHKRVRSKMKEIFYYIYVVNRTDLLVGVITLQELMLADPKKYLTAVMHRPVEKISARAKREAILLHPGWKYLHTLPVVDENDIFLGVIKYQTMRELEKENMKQPMQGVLPTLFALSELYSISVTRFLRLGDDEQKNNRKSQG